MNYYARVTTNKLFNAWRDMIRRCSNKKRHNYKWYGGRGIKVVSEWLDFKTFVDWSLQSGFKEGLSLDRIDNSGNYSPTNCHWVTHKQQCLNRRSNKVLTFNNKSLTISEWAIELNISPSTLYNRIASGWTIEEALTVAPNPKNNTKVGRL